MARKYAAISGKKLSNKCAMAIILQIQSRKNGIAAIIIYGQHRQMFIPQQWEHGAIQDMHLKKNHRRIAPGIRMLIVN
ncbi:MAG: hypothetical protein QXZ44_06520 [Ferroplasma sp.]